MSVPDEELRMTSEDLDQALDAAMRMHPDVPGAGRLCQELLARITGRQITVTAARVVRLIGANNIGSPGNPYGSKGRPRPKSMRESD